MGTDEKNVQDVSGYLREHGLYAERSWCESSIKVRSRKNDSLRFTLTADELKDSKTSTAVIELIKTKL